MIEQFLKWLEKMITGTARAPNNVAQMSVHKRLDEQQTDEMNESKNVTNSNSPVTSEVNNVHSKPIGSERMSESSNTNNKPKTPRQIVVFRRLLLLIVGGVLLILIANIFELDNKLVDSNLSEQPHQAVANLESPLRTSDSPFMSIEQALEQRTKDILEKMIGVGNVNVLITVESTEEQMIKTNTNESKSITEETDKNGGMREVTTTTNDGQVVFMETDGEQAPVVTKIINPRIRGVLIVAEGAEDATVRKLIIQAVEKGLNVHQSKISVVPSKI